MLINYRKYTVAAAISLLLCSCVGSKGYTPAPERADTLEPYNRAMFTFNLKADKYVIKPLAKGYRAVTTPEIRDKVMNVLNNVHEPLYTINNGLQGDIKQSGIEVARFAINTTLGLGGLFDVADGWGLKKVASGFDKTFAIWCMNDGPYIVLPLLGPATIRSTVSYGADAVVNPIYYATYHDANVSDKLAWGFTIVEGIAIREKAMDLTDDLEKNAIDAYASMRTMFLQNHEKINRLCSRAATADTSFDFDFDDSEYDEEDFQD